MHLIASIYHYITAPHTENWMEAALFGLVYLLTAALLYIAIRTLGWIIAGFFD